MADVFVSYARDDRPRVEQLAKALEARGLDVWWDPELLAGQSYAQEIKNTLNTVAAVIVVWSKTSTERPWVLDEAGVGQTRGVLVPVMIDAVRPPAGFAQLHTENLAHWPGPEGEANFERLIQALEALKARKAAAPAVPPPAPPPAAQPAVAGAFSGAAGGARKGLPWPMILGGGALAVLAIVAFGQIVGTPANPTGDDSGGGGIVTAVGDSSNAYGLAPEELATLDINRLITRAIETSSIDAIREGASQGDALGEMLMCLANDQGVGTAADPFAAKGWCEKGAASGHPLATLMLSRAHRAGLYGLSADAAQANALLEGAAQAGDARAQYDLAYFHLEGSDGLPKDDARVLTLARAAGEQGYRPAQFLLGWMYENGRAVGQDYATALLWYKKLADEGDPAGLRAVGWMHQNGFGATKDVAKAVELYKQASDGGDGNASHNLAYLYETGEGVEKNLDEAVRLYRLADSQGYAGSIERLKELGFAD